MKITILIIWRVTSQTELSVKIRLCARTKKTRTPAPLLSLSYLRLRPLQRWTNRFRHRWRTLQNTLFSIHEQASKRGTTGRIYYLLLLVLLFYCVQENVNICLVVWLSAVSFLGCVVGGDVLCFVSMAYPLVLHAMSEAGSSA